MGRECRNLLITTFLYIIFISIALIPSVNAAIIHRTVYDIALDQESNVKIEVNTTPQQMFISKNGTYQFELTAGQYMISANTNSGSAEENITIESNQGDYVLDIVLDPVFDNPYIQLTDNVSISNENPDSFNKIENTANIQSSSLSYIILIAAAIILILIMYMIFYSRKMLAKESLKLERAAKDVKVEATHGSVAIDEYGKNVLSIIKKESRITQKDLRKQVPLSEGKISLIISDLESQGKIRKIKKGRGNILVYEKD